MRQEIQAGHSHPPKALVYKVTLSDHSKHSILGVTREIPIFKMCAEQAGPDWTCVVLPLYCGFTHGRVVVMGWAEDKIPSVPKPLQNSSVFDFWDVGVTLRPQRAIPLQIPRPPNSQYSSQVQVLCKKYSAQSNARTTAEMQSLSFVAQRAVPKIRRCDAMVYDGWSAWHAYEHAFLFEELISLRIIKADPLRPLFCTERWGMQLALPMHFAIQAHVK